MEGQAWLVVALCSIVAVVPCCASAKAQLVYNSDGTPRLEIVNTGVPGQRPQGRWSWQTPEDKLVWIQYPVNDQGNIPWTPAEYAYSVVSNLQQRFRSNRGLEDQNPNNNFQSSEEEDDDDEDEQINSNTHVVNPTNIHQQLHSNSRDEAQNPNNNSQSFEEEEEEEDDEEAEEYDDDDDDVEDDVQIKSNTHVVNPTNNHQQLRSNRRVEAQNPNNNFQNSEEDDSTIFHDDDSDDDDDDDDDDEDDDDDDEDVEQINSNTHVVNPTNNHQQLHSNSIVEAHYSPSEASWQTAEGTSVWIQYPINTQGFIPWTPSEYAYSVASYPTKKVFPDVSQYDERIHYNTQVINPTYNQQQSLRSDRRIDAQFPNNNYQSSTLFQSIPKEDKNVIKIEKATSETPPIAESIDMDFPDTTEIFSVTTTEKALRTTSERPRFTFPFTTTTTRSLPFNPASFTPGPSYSEIYKPKTTSTTTMEEPDYIELPTESPIQFYTVQSIEDALTTAKPIDESNIDTIDMREHVVDISDKEVIPATESVFENNVYNEIDNINSLVETDEQVEDTTELGPVIRLTSRGRPQIFNNPQNQLPKTRKQSITHAPNDRPVAQLIEDPSLRLINTRKPAFSVNTENRFRPRIPGIRNRPGMRFRPGLRRNSITENAIARLNIQADEQSNRGIARAGPSLSSRLRSPGYARVRRI